MRSVIDIRLIGNHTHLTTDIIYMVHGWDQSKMGNLQLIHAKNIQE
jgi:hypothetical protein